MAPRTPRPLLLGRTRLGVGVALALLVTGCSAPATPELPAPWSDPLAVSSAPLAVSPAPLAVSPAPLAVSSTEVLAESEPTRIRIPGIDVDSDLIDLGLQADGTMEVPADGSVAGWYTGAPTPGELGPAVIAAHVDWKGEPGVFVELGDLTPGEDVRIERADGVTAVFRVSRVERYAKDRFPTDVVYGDIDHAGLRLITCGGDFDRGALSYVDNVVVYAGLVGSA